IFLPDERCLEGRQGAALDSVAAIDSAHAEEDAASGDGLSFRRAGARPGGHHREWRIRRDRFARASAWNRLALGSVDAGFGAGVDGGAGGGWRARGTFFWRGRGFGLAGAGKDRGPDGVERESAGGHSQYGEYRDGDEGWEAVRRGYAG